MTTQSTALFREMMKTGRRFADYNIREYSLRRVRDGFRKNAGLKDPAAVSEAFKEANESLELMKRQVTVYQLYSKTKSILDKKK